MPCSPVVLPGGGFAILCTARQRRRACRSCGTLTARLCDFELHGKKAGKTCDAPVCDRCRTSIGPDRDLCPPHAKLYAESEDAIVAKAAAVQLELAEQAGLAREAWG